MKWTKDHRPDLLLGTLTTGLANVYAGPFETRDTDANAELADIAEIEVEWSGLAGGASNSVIETSMFGVARNAGAIDTGAEAATNGILIGGVSFNGAFAASANALVSNGVANGRGIAHHMRAHGGIGAPYALPIHPIVWIRFSNAGTAYTNAGSLYLRRVTFYNSRTPARQR